MPLLLRDLGFVGLGSALRNGYFRLLARLTLNFVIKFDLPQTMLQHVVLMFEVGVHGLGCRKFALEFLELVRELFLLKEPHVFLECDFLVL